MTKQELEKIKNLKDYAELALVSYCTGLRSGMFMADFIGYRDDKITDREYNKLPTYFEVLTATSHCCRIYKKMLY